MTRHNVCEAVVMVVLRLMVSLARRDNLLAHRDYRRHAA